MLPVISSLGKSFTRPGNKELTGLMTRTWSSSPTLKVGSFVYLPSMGQLLIPVSSDRQNGHPPTILPLRHLPAATVLPLHPLQCPPFWRQHLALSFTSSPWNPLPVDGRILEIPSSPNDRRLGVSTQTYRCRHYRSIHNYA